MQLRMRLMKTHKIEVIRAKPNQLINGRLVQDGDPEVIRGVECSIQPFRYDQKQFPLPEGFKVDDCRIVYSQSFMFKVASVEDQTDPDRFRHEGVEYVVYQHQPWTGFQLKADHNLVLAVRSDKVNVSEH